MTLWVGPFVCSLFSVLVAYGIRTRAFRGSFPESVPAQYLPTLPPLPHRFLCLDLVGLVRLGLLLAVPAFCFSASASSGAVVYSSRGEGCWETMAHSPFLLPVDAQCSYAFIVVLGS